MKSDLAKLNINLSVQSLAWPTQWAKGKSSTASQHQDIFMEYWWPDYADPYSWFINLLDTESPPYFNLSYYSDKTLDGMINKVEPLVATNRTAAEQLYRRCRCGSLAPRRSCSCTTQLPVRDAEQLPGSRSTPRTRTWSSCYDLKP